jgi:phosphoglycolate phosphatase-like HAD superfamily hydrolase
VKILLSFDIDGTLEAGDPPGPLTFEMVVKAKELGCTIGSASDRALSAQQSMWDRAGIEPHFTAQKHRFDELLAKFPDHDIYLHIGDRNLDLQFAKEAGLSFLWMTDCTDEPWLRWLEGETPVFPEYELP